MTTFLLLLLLTAPPTPGTLKKSDRVQSPKAAEQTARAGVRMALVAPPKTNVFRLNFAWQGSASVLCYGLTRGGPWTNTVPMATGTSYAFSKTNWAERSLRHFFVVRNGTNGPPSNEVHYPPYPPDHVALTWNTNARTVLFSSPVLARPIRQWPVLADVTGTNRWDGALTSGSRFFTATNGQVLGILLYNPLN